jgi:glyoxylase-like metal-dependent hydrolase (beta-lactamase superfamily II)
MKLPHCMITGLLLLGCAPANAAQTPEPVKFSVGQAQVTVLQDMPGQMDTGLFRGASAEELKARAPSGKAEAGVHVFMVKNDGKTILIDTGYGLNDRDRVSALPALLQKTGVKPESVDIVLLTHMHGDHIGGLLHDGKALFPNAQIKVSEPELAFWTDEKTARDYPDRAKNIAMVNDVRAAYGKKMTSFAFGDEVAPGLAARDTRGHTPGHTLFLLSSGKGKLYFWGDLVHSAAFQFANPEICAVYDMDMPQAVSARRTVMESAARENIPVAGAHLPYPAVGRVVSDAKSRNFAFLPGLK